MNCTRSAVKHILECNPEVRQELADEKERCLDRIIVDAKQKAIKGDRFARDSVLKAEAKERGYGDKTEEKQDNNKSIIVLHYNNVSLTANHNNGMKSKEARLETWAAAAKDYNDRQAKSIQNKSVEQILETMEKNNSK